MKILVTSITCKQDGVTMLWSQQMLVNDRFSGRHNAGMEFCFLRSRYSKQTQDLLNLQGKSCYFGSPGRRVTSADAACTP